MDEPTVRRLAELLERQDRLLEQHGKIMTLHATLLEEALSIYAATVELLAADSGSADDDRSLNRTARASRGV